MSRTKVVCLKIEKFRRFQDIDIPLGDHVTVIAGQNGTSKSTLLGMLAQPFSFGIVRGKSAKKPDASSYTSNYHGIKLREITDRTGKPFMYDCDDIFRLSTKFDYGNDYQYGIQLSFPANADIELPNNSLLTKSRPRNNDGKTSMRFVTGPGASHESGQGNYPHPVLYLGLNRLWPLASTKECKFSGEPLSEEDREWYVTNYNEILCLDEHNNDAKFMDTAEKRKFITPESNNYDGESCSAGQDNLSQILTAILSFRGLKERLGERYQGGMLLIDEVDATLHAFAQSGLLKLLCDVSHELRLQIVVTSHSLSILKMAYQSNLSKDITLLYLANSDGIVVRKEFTYNEICAHLRVEATLPKKKQKVSLVFEDNEGQYLFNKICGSTLSSFICRTNTASFPAGYLKNLADISKSLPELQKVIFLPDGDMAKTWSNPPKNLLALPGNERPETLIYRHLFSLKESDPFWEKCSPTYSRQVAIVAEGGNTIEKGDDKSWVKKWYKKQSPYWGRANCRVFNSWIQANQEDCLKFFNKFIKLLRDYYKGEISQAKIDKIRSKFQNK